MFNFQYSTFPMDIAVHAYVHKILMVVFKSRTHFFRSIITCTYLEGGDLSRILGGSGTSGRGGGLPLGVGGSGGYTGGGGIGGSGTLGGTMGGRGTLGGTIELGGTCKINIYIVVTRDRYRLIEKQNNRIFAKIIVD